MASRPMGVDQPTPTDLDYVRLAAFRHALRRFLNFSAAAAQAAGLTPHQHQAILAIKGKPKDGSPGSNMTIGELADQLVIAPHTAAELVARLEAGGLVRKVGDADDRRRVRLVLTAHAETALTDLSVIHLREVRGIAPRLMVLLAAFERAIGPG